MSYSEQLHAWVIVRLLPKMKRRIVRRFRRWGDADSYLKILRQGDPKAEFLLIWDLVDQSVPLESPEDLPEEQPEI
jgi:hypothetical protein